MTYLVAACNFGNDCAGQVDVLCIVERHEEKGETIEKKRKETYKQTQTQTQTHKHTHTLSLSHAHTYIYYMARTTRRTVTTS